MDLVFSLVEKSLKKTTKNPENIYGNRMDRRKTGNTALNFLKENMKIQTFAVFEHKTSCCATIFVLAKSIDF